MTETRSADYAPMIEAPQPGFTGVVWPARPADRLARDLTTGPGSVPMGEAVQGWTRLAAAFGNAVADYERVVTQLRVAWQSNSSGQVLERISTLRDWLGEAAGAAAANAGRFQVQVSAYEVARLAMPHTADIEQLQQVQRMLGAVGAMLGAPLTATGAEIDKEADVAKAVASRVMENYEKATEPLARPWAHPAPPVIAPETALAGEAAQQAAETGSQQSISTAALEAGVSAARSALLGAMTIPLKQSVYQAPAFLQSTAEVSPSAATRAQFGETVTSSPAGMPTSGAVGSGQQQDDVVEPSRFPRASLPDGDSLGVDLHAAPAVLGGVDNDRLVVQAERAAQPEAGVARGFDGGTLLAAAGRQQFGDGA